MATATHRPINGSGNAAVEAASDPLDGLRAALLRLDLRLKLTVESQRETLAERARDPFHGLYLSEEQVDALLANSPPVEAIRHMLGGEAGDTTPRFAHLARVFNLTPFEQEALLICLAPDVDLRYERLYGYLQDDATRRRPTVDLILRLLVPNQEDRVVAREVFSPRAALVRHGLLVHPDEASSASLLARPLRPDERIVEFLLGSDRPDARLGAIAQLHLPTERAATAASATDKTLGETNEGLARLLAAGQDASLIYLHGGPGTAKGTTAHVMCRVAGRTLLLLDAAALLASERPELLLTLAVREARLHQAVLGVDNFDKLLDDAPGPAGGAAAPNATASALRAQLRRLLVESRLPAILCGEVRWEPATWLPTAEGFTAVRVELAAPGPGARAQLWQEQLEGLLPPEELAALAARYRLEPDAIHAVDGAARARAAWRGAQRPDAADYRAAARAVSAPPLEGLAKRLEPRYGWEDIVLTPDGRAQLSELCSRVRHQPLVLETWGYGHKLSRKSGVSALFAGAPGTGKTMAAEIVAGELGLELFRIDLSAVVSKYIGETEKNLEQIFRAADRGDAVLLFDEADAIFGKRSEVKDAHDRHANVEIAYLLQRLEAYEGLAVLTTNLRGNIDEAFLRRLDCVMEFALPEEAERLAIWRRSLPNDVPLAQDVDLPFMARKFKLAGGHIKNIALTAAYLAAAETGAVAMQHLVRATRREYQKLGKLVNESDFEQYFSLLKSS